MTCKIRVHFGYFLYVNGLIQGDFDESANRSSGTWSTVDTSLAWAAISSPLNLAMNQVLTTASLYNWTRLHRHDVSRNFQL